MAFDFADLTPDLIFDGLAQTGLQLDSGLTELNSYENRVYQFQDQARQRYVVKFYRPERWQAEQILAEHKFCQQLQAAELPVAAPLSLAGQTLFTQQGYLFALWPSVGGRSFEVDNLEQLESVGRHLGQLHQLSASLTLAQRPNIDCDRMLRQPRELLIQGNWLPSMLAQPFFSLLDELIEQVEQAMARPYQTIALHGDCHPGNILWCDGPCFVDFDDCGYGPAIQDLWMLLNGSRQEQLVQLDTLLASYEEFRVFDSQELALIEPLRTMRMVHYMAWLAKRWQDPAFARHFPWFNTHAYWQQQFKALQEQQQALKAPPLSLSPQW